MVTREAAVALFGRLDLADNFRHIYCHKPVPPQVAAHFHCPEELFDRPDNSSGWTQSRLVPLFGDPRSGQYVAFDLAQDDLVEVGHGSSPTLAPRFRSWQHYLAERVIRLAESGAAEDELRAFSDAIGFHYLLEILGFLDACLDHPAEEYQARRKTCLEWLPA